MPGVGPAILTALNLLLKTYGPEGPARVLDEIGRIMIQAQSTVVPAEEAEKNRQRIEALIDFWKQILPLGKGSQQAIDPRRVGVVTVALSQIGAVSAFVPAGVDPEDPKYRHFRQGWEHLNEYFLLAYGGSGQGKYLEDDVRYVENKLQSWCDIFALWACRRLGVLSAHWQMGSVLSPILLSAGWTYHDMSKEPERSYVPQSGDIGIRSKVNHGHHSIVVSADGENLAMIDGNTSSSDNPAGGQVMTQNRTKNHFAGGGGVGIYSPPY